MRLFVKLCHDNKCIQQISMEGERESVSFIGDGNSATGRRDNTVIPVKVQLVIWISCILMALVAVIISLVSLKGTSVNVNVSSVRTPESATVKDEKIWTFVIYQSGKNLDYTDEVTGEPKGFLPDLVYAVCRIANKTCRLVRDSWKKCWSATPGEPGQGGIGLFGRHYDGCVGGHHTYERALVFQFSDPWSQTKPGAFYVKPGNPRGFNWLDLTNKTIGFIDGLAFDERCIARVDQIKGNVLTKDQIRDFASRDLLLSAVLNEEVDAGFDIEEGYKKNEDVEQASDDIRVCVVAGMCMMVLKDSRLPEWWNPAQKQLMDSKEYRTICDDLKEQHGHWPGPTPEEYCIGY